jgi:haloalkane dehalogenase
MRTNIPVHGFGSSLFQVNGGHRGMYFGWRLSYPVPETFPKTFCPRKLRANWLGKSNVPKLFLEAEPGAILTNDTLLKLVRRWPALPEKSVAGIHFVQENSPNEIGGAIADWMGASR